MKDLFVWALVVSVILTSVYTYQTRQKLIQCSAFVEELSKR